MKTWIIIAAIAYGMVACQDTTKPVEKVEVTPAVKTALIAELTEMEKTDQLNRNFIAFGTFNQHLIDSVQQLSVSDYIAFEMSHQRELTQTQLDSLERIQNQVDHENINRFYTMIETYGWLDETVLDSTIDPMILLFHTPIETIDKMQTLLLAEVKAERMPPIQYATYVDNMRMKSGGKPQLYGTGEEYDIVLGATVPPLIENIDSTNAARRAIGLPELKVGEYRSE